MKCLNLIFLLALMLGSTGCGLIAASTAGVGTVSGNVQASTRAIEELWLAEGEGPLLFRYAEDLLYQGRYREALTVYYNCEMTAYTAALREAARTRRMWVQEMIVAYETGARPEPPPVVDNSQGYKVPPKPMYDQRDFYGKADMSVVSAHPRQLKPNKHYVQDEAAYHIYGYPVYPGDISPEQVKIPEKPAYRE